MTEALNMCNVDIAQMFHLIYAANSSEIKYYFSALEEQVTELQIHDLILDVGFGFSKTLEQNFT